MPYVVIHGEVHNGTERYHVGDIVPSSIVDEALEHSGGLAWSDDISEPPAKPHAEMTNRELRELITSRGVKPPFVANKAELVALLEAEDEGTEEAREA
jgi:hypothetical protein